MEIIADRAEGGMRDALFGPSLSLTQGNALTTAISEEVISNYSSALDDYVAALSQQDKTQKLLGFLLNLLFEMARA